MPVQDEETVFSTRDKFFNQDCGIFCEGNFKGFLIVFKTGRFLENGDSQTKVG